MKIHKESLIIGAILGGAIVWILQTRGYVFPRAYVERVRPDEPVVFGGGGYSGGG